jgi:hypothetical protein
MSDARDDQADEQDEAEALDADTTDSLDDDYPLDYPPERPLGVEEYGLTGAEEETGESERLRSARELPEDDGRDLPEDDLDDDADELITGLSVADDAIDGELLGELVDVELDPSAEESAMHIVDEP